MKGKNMIVLLVTILVMVSLVSIAAYSYFSATVTNSSAAIINTTTPGGVATLTTTGGSAVINIAAANMTAQKGGNLAGSASTTLKISLTGKDSSTVSCNYTVYFKLDTGSSNYTQTGSKEFTYALTSAASGGSSNGTDVSTTLAKTTNVTTEVQVNATTATSTLGTPVASNNQIFTTGTTATVVTYTITMRYYNLAQSQVNQNAKFIGKFHVANVTC